LDLEKPEKLPKLNSRSILKAFHFTHKHMKGINANM